jgi:ADP-ribosylation factor GTPase-activating protein 1
MDAFKQNEILRMQHGGNKAWQDFYNSNIGSENGGKSFDDSSIKERYESDVGDEWKERLSAKVDDKDFDQETWKKEREAYKAKAAAKTNASNRTQTPTGGPRKAIHGITSTTSNPTSRSQSPSFPPSSTQKEKNETYFSSLGATNASRPENLPPSQGGRYAGFGSSSTPPPPHSSSQSQTARPPNASEFQSDPVAALSKGLGWFTTSLTRTAKTVNEAYIQPTAKNIAASDLAAQARAAALQAGSGIQSGAKTASESFNRFVEGQGGDQPRPAAGAPASTGTGGTGPPRTAPKTVEPERKDFWDTFGAAPTAATGPEAANPNPKPKSSSIGTAAMKKSNTGSGSSTHLPLPLPVPGSAATAPAGKGKEDGWDEW